jgi:outer membrane protein
MNFSLRYISFGFSVFIILFAIAAVSVPAQESQVAKNLSEVETPAAPASEEKSRSVKTGRGIDPTKTSLARVGVQTAEPISLTLNDAIRKALESNNDIEVSRDDVRFQETQVRSLRGFYDPVFTVNPTYNRNSSTGSAATNDFSVSSDFTQSIKHGGGNYSVFFNNTRTENAFSQAQVSNGSISGGSSAIFLSSTGFRYTQPLLRNLAIDNTRRNLKIARRRLEQTDADFRRTTIETIARVQNAYWDLVFALRDQQNRSANVDLARENLRQIEARISAGASAPLARAEVATELATRESDLLLATQQVSIAENVVKQLLLKDATSAEWTQSYVPTDRPAFSLNTVSLDNAIKDAMDNRYELQRLKLARDINKIDIDYFRNQTRPQVDLNTQFSLDGLARGGASTDSTLIPQFIGNEEILRQRLNLLLPPADQIPNPNVEIAGTPNFLAGGFNRSLANLLRGDAPNYSVGLTISFPLRNRTAKANLAGAKVTENQLLTQTRIQEQVVIVEVRNAVQAVETSRQRVLTARTARENAEIQLEGERRLFDSGRSTTFLLFQRENALTNARNLEIRAETDYNKALADLQKATSTTFELNNIQVTSPIDQK